MENANKLNANGILHSNQLNIEENCAGSLTVNGGKKQVTKQVREQARRSTC